VNLQLRWAKTDSASLGAGHTDNWNLFYQVNPNATGTNVAWQKRQHQLHLLRQRSDVAADRLRHAQQTSWSNGVSLGNPVINFGSGGITQFADANGNVQVNQIHQDGFPAGPVAIGRRQQQWPHRRQLLQRPQPRPRRNFGSRPSTEPISSSASTAARSKQPTKSGQALYGRSGTIVGSSLESSNTDIADEFTKLIITQQAYSANTKVITTSNSMVQDLLNVLR